MRSIGKAAIISSVAYALSGIAYAQLPLQEPPPIEARTTDELEQLVLRHDTLEFKEYFTRNVEAAVVPLSKILAERMAGFFQQEPRGATLKERAERVWKFIMPPIEDRITRPEGTVYLLDVVQRALDAHYRAMGAVQWADIVYGAKTGSLQRMMDPSDRGYGYVHTGDLGIITGIRIHERNVIRTLMRDREGNLLLERAGKELVPATERKPAVTVEFLFAPDEYKVLFPIVQRTPQYHGEIPDGEGTRPYTFGFSPTAILDGAQLVVKDVEEYQRSMELQARLAQLANQPPEGMSEKKRDKEVRKLEEELNGLVVWVQVANPNAEKPFIIPSPSTKKGPGGFCDASCQQPSSGFGTFQPPSDGPPS